MVEASSVTVQLCGLFIILCLLTTAKDAECNETDMIRLVDGVTPHDGRVEICIEEGLWVAVCDDQLNLKHASIICRQLGYDGCEFECHPHIKYNIIRRFFLCSILSFALWLWWQSIGDKFLFETKF